MGMTIKAYNNFSLYAATPQIVNYGINYLDFWTPPKLTTSPSDTYITLAAKYNLRPDLLAYDYYQKSDYWWVFMMRNRDTIIDPIWDFTADKYIYIPKKDTLIKSLGV